MMQPRENPSVGVVLTISVNSYRPYEKGTSWDAFRIDDDHALQRRLNYNEECLIEELAALLAQSWQPDSWPQLKNTAPLDDDVIAQWRPPLQECQMQSGDSGFDEQSFESEGVPSSLSSPLSDRGEISFSAARVALFTDAVYKAVEKEAALTIGSKTEEVALPSSDYAGCTVSSSCTETVGSAGAADKAIEKLSAFTVKQILKNEGVSSSSSGHGGNAELSSKSVVAGIDAASEDEVRKGIEEMEASLIAKKLEEIEWHARMSREFARPLRKPPSDYVCESCFMRDHHIVEDCPKRALQPGLTPYQGHKLCEGEFMCEKCKRQWTSSKSQANMPELCRKCKVPVYPRKQYRRPSELTSSIRAHQSVSRAASCPMAAPVNVRRCASGFSRYYDGPTLC